MFPCLYGISKSWAISFPAIFLSLCTQNLWPGRWNSYFFVHNNNCKSSLKNTKKKTPEKKMGTCLDSEAQETWSSPCLGKGIIKWGLSRFQKLSKNGYYGFLKNNAETECSTNVLFLDIVHLTAESALCSSIIPIF
jgi:hypothetical protein